MRHSSPLASKYLKPLFPAHAAHSHRHHAMPRDLTPPGASAPTFAYVAQGHRGHQQDRHVHGSLDLSDGTTAAIAAVFDGHGAPETGHATSALLEAEFVPAVQAELHAGRSVADALREAVEAVEAAALGLSAEKKEYHGSTLAACVVLDGGRRVVTANVGDSRVVVVEGGWGRAGDDAMRAGFSTVDHKPTAAGERMRIEAAGGWVNAGGMLNGFIGMSRAIGDNDLKGHRNIVAFGPRTDGKPETAEFGEDLLTAEPDIVEMEVTQRDHFVVVATDGVWHVLTNDEAAVAAAEAVGKGRNPAKEVVKTALKRGARDNITVVIAPLSGDAKQMFSEVSARKRWARPGGAGRATSGRGAGAGKEDVEGGRKGQKMGSKMLGGFRRKRPATPAAGASRAVVDDSSVHGGHAFSPADFDDLSLHGTRDAYGAVGVSLDDEGDDTSEDSSADGSGSARDEDGEEESLTKVHTYQGDAQK